MLKKAETPFTHCFIWVSAFFLLISVPSSVTAEQPPNTIANNGASQVSVSVKNVDGSTSTMNVPPGETLPLPAGSVKVTLWGTNGQANVHVNADGKDIKLGGLGDKAKFAPIPETAAQTGGTGTAKQGGGDKPPEKGEGGKEPAPKDKQEPKKDGEKKDSAPKDKTDKKDAPPKEKTKDEKKADTKNDQKNFKDWAEGQGFLPKGQPKLPKPEKEGDGVGTPDPPPKPKPSTTGMKPDPNAPLTDLEKAAKAMFGDGEEMIQEQKAREEKAKKDAEGKKNKQTSMGFGDEFKGANGANAIARDATFASADAKPEDAKEGAHC